METAKRFKAQEREREREREIELARKKGWGEKTETMLCLEEEIISKIWKYY